MAKKNNKQEQASTMKLLGKQLLAAFTQKHTDATKWIENWIADVEGSAWQIPQNIKDKYPTASFLKDNVVIFNVKGNNYRLETKVSYKLSIVDTLWVGTHKEYDERNKGR